MSDDTDGQRLTTTASADESKERRRERPVPGLVLLYADRRATLRVFRAGAESIEIGRVELAPGDVLDGMISRKHVRVSFDLEFRIEDLSSLNGTFVGGRRISGEARAAAGTPVRVGGAVLLCAADVLPFERYGAGLRGEFVEGPALRRALEIARAATEAEATLLIEGESGTGRGLVARAFHDAGATAAGPLHVVECAALPRECAEALLFGSTHDAFPGAVEAEGHAHAAAGGTLFLDEVCELTPDVQKKLLRLLEARELVRAGGTVAERVALRVCASSSRPLRGEVNAGRFRQDLYVRLARPELRLPPLRERLEEVPWHVQQALEAHATAEQPQRLVSASFIEACLSRPWPGNVRELRAELDRAVAAATAEGSLSLSAEDLSPTAGRPRPKGTAVVRFPEDDVAKALMLEAGNVLGAARRLGVHRNKVRRWLERHHVDAGAFKRRSSV